jgi:NADH-quinone oxidoreductase subunit A
MLRNPFRAPWIAVRLTNRAGGPALPEQYYPVLLMLGIAIALAVAILGLSQLLGQQTGGRVKGTTVESGMPLLDRSHKRMSIAFFLIAIDFIVFDLEAAFLYPWALIMREGGWELFAAVMVFFFLILVGYAYIWLKGGLELGPRRERRSRSAPSAKTAEVLP